MEPDVQIGAVDVPIKSVLPYQWVSHVFQQFRIEWLRFFKLR
ncbi:Uncharacterised protein [Vibrio cholerae]|uniref:Uncharacterized protein n=1 Tax=Vibrio cholerae TaxID=666 RepID=A0A655Y6E2_VIBCL|nr:Uncharacterised protein [Vibrio cholerae]